MTKSCSLLVLLTMYMTDAFFCMLENECVCLKVSVKGSVPSTCIILDARGHVLHEPILKTRLVFVLFIYELYMHGRFLHF